MKGLASSNFVTLGQVVFPLVDKDFQRFFSQSPVLYPVDRLEVIENFFSISDANFVDNTARQVYAARLHLLAHRFSYWK